jgi:D-aminoacyl-tRNA deacylase
LNRLIDMLGILISHADSASVNIGEQLRELIEWTEHMDTETPAADGGGLYHRLEGNHPVEYRTVESRHLDLRRPADVFSQTPNLLVFASRHAGNTASLLTAHTTGNFGLAELGGADHALAETAPNALAQIHAEFITHAPSTYEVGLECTHHGPTEVGCPSLFAELGSDTPQWTDKAGAEAVARSILALREIAPHRARSIIGIGGGHYAHRFEQIVVETDWAVGHVASDWALEDMGDPREYPEVFERAFEASGATRALLNGDADREEMHEFIMDLGYETVSETWLRETSEVSLGTVMRVEDRLGPVEDGTRFGEPARKLDEAVELTVTMLPPQLVTECVGIDREKTRATIANQAIAFTTQEGGTIPTGTVLSSDESSRGAILDALVQLLEVRYDEVERETGFVRVQTREFDASKARTLGIAEGPAFGKLANGQAVEVDGRRIDPEVVSSMREERFDLRDGQKHPDNGFGQDN